MYPAPSYLANATEALDNAILAANKKEFRENQSAFSFQKTFVNLLQTNAYTENAGIISGIDEKGNHQVIFNHSQHGFAGLMGNIELPASHASIHRKLAPHSSIIISFQYKGDEEDFTADIPGKIAADFFRWVRIYQYEGKQLKQLFSYDCE
jgi:hypothetical protein